MSSRNELLFLQADDESELMRQALELAEVCARWPDRPLVELAAEFSANEVTATYRCAVVAPSVPELGRQLARVADPTVGVSRVPRATTAGAVAYRGAGPVGGYGRVAWLFPGEGAQYTGMLEDLCVSFPRARACFDLLDHAIDAGPRPSSAIFPPDKAERTALWRMDGAVEAVLTANRAVAAVLRGLGLVPDVVVGHSTGEYSALLEAGAFDLTGDEALADTLRLGNRISRELDAAGAIPEGALLAVGAIEQTVLSAVLDHHTDAAWLALDNCPSQMVVFAAREAAPAVTASLQHEGALVQPLPFGRAYHTPLFKSVIDALAPLLGELPLREPRLDVWSSATAAPYPAEPQDLARVLSAQWTTTVRFRETVEHLYDAGVRVFVESGPRGNLRQFVQDTLRSRHHVAVAADHPRVPGMTQLQHLAGALAAAGVRIDLRPLRLTRPPTPSRREVPLRLGLPTLSLTAPPKPEPTTETTPTCATEPAQPPKLTGQDGTDGGTWIVELDPARDRWLRDHALGSRVSRIDPDLSALVVVPFTVSLELMARAAARVAAGRRPTALRDVHAYRWLVIDDAPLTLAIRATPGPFGVHVEIAETQHPDGGVAVEGTVVLDQSSPREAPLAIELTGARPAPWHTDELYRHGMFHGPAFRGVRSVDAVGADGVLGTVYVRAELPGPAPLTAPLHVDACGQLVGFWTAARLNNGFAVFPRGLERLELPTDPLPTGQPLRAEARIGKVLQDTVTADLAAYDSLGHVTLRAIGWTDTRVRLPAALFRLRVDPAHELLSEPWPVGADGSLVCRLVRLDDRLLGNDHGLWLEVLASLVLSRAERVTWRRVRESPRALGWLAGRIAAKDAARCPVGRPRLAVCAADLPIDADPLGAPQLAGTESPMSVSISHYGDSSVAVVDHGGDPVGVDVESLSRKPSGLAGAVIGPAEQEAAGLPEPGPELALRLWCAKQAAAKAFGIGMPDGPESVRVTASDHDGSSLQVVPGQAVLALRPILRGAHAAVRVTRQHDLITAIARR